ncbi:MAG: helix-turn-helix transcriptional regulator [Opitutae bacterium]|nr:helix-turn-helix transcriptional regulator [Opitutae bacterium]
MPKSGSSRRNLAGKVVLRLRKAQGLTREQLAAKLHIRGWDVTRKVVERIENGRREINDLELRVLARALRVPIETLFESN